jgi:hypothetical protein
MIRPDKEVKREFKGIASAHPDNYYATAVLKREGFVRKRCAACGTFFWTVNASQDVCGDPSCSGGFRLFENNPSKNKMSYVQTWQSLTKHFSVRGYRIMNRYPVVARWNPTMDFTIASIAAFQPHVISGEVEPPAKKLLIPQFCLRFGDIDNVGITGSHLTGFIMVGQHMFVPPEEWNQNQAFQDLYDWFRNELGLPKEELTFHEDAWAGGGNFGPCMEFFSRGVELCNQVYMLYQQTPDGDIGLKLKVLDMGLGLERCAWFSQGKGTAYDATFPAVIHKILERTSHVPNYELQKKFLPKASYLNVDEVDNIGEAWERVARELSVNANDLRQAIEPMQAIYSIAEHARSLLFALTDGGLPSNVGGGYNLRTIFRRAQGFIEKFHWNLDMGEVAQWHAEELKDMFPELLENIQDTKKILAVEKEKHIQMTSTPRYANGCCPSAAARRSAAACVGPSASRRVRHANAARTACGTTAALSAANGLRAFQTWRATCQLKLILPAPSSCAQCWTISRATGGSSYCAASARSSSASLPLCGQDCRC